MITPDQFQSYIKCIGDAPEETGTNLNTISAMLQFMIDNPAYFTHTPYHIMTNYLYSFDNDDTTSEQLLRYNICHLWDSSEHSSIYNQFINKINKRIQYFKGLDQGIPIYFTFHSIIKKMKKLKMMHNDIDGHYIHSIRDNGTMHASDFSYNEPMKCWMNYIKGGARFLIIE